MKDKRVYESFTDDDPGPRGKRKCEAKAATWAAEKEKKAKVKSITVDEAVNSQRYH